MPDTAPSLFTLGSFGGVDVDVRPAASVPLGPGSMFMWQLMAERGLVSGAR